MIFAARSHGEVHGGAQGRLGRSARVLDGILHRPLGDGGHGPSHKVGVLLHGFAANFEQVFYGGVHISHRRARQLPGAGLRLLHWGRLGGWDGHHVVDLLRAPALLLGRDVDGAEEGAVLQRGLLCSGTEPCE